MGMLCNHPKQGGWEVIAAPIFSLHIFPGKSIMRWGCFSCLLHDKIDTHLSECEYPSHLNYFVSTRGHHLLSKFSMLCSIIQLTTGKNFPGTARSCPFVLLCGSNDFNPLCLHAPSHCCPPIIFFFFLRTSSKWLQPGSVACMSSERPCALNALHLTCLCVIFSPNFLSYQLLSLSNKPECFLSSEKERLIFLFL